MEDLLIALFQVIFEVLAYLPWDFFSYGRFDAAERGDADFGHGLLSLVVGASLGGFSLLVLPDVVAKWPWLRIALLIIGPFVSGLLAFGFAEMRLRRGWNVRPTAHFWFSWLFTLGLVVVRFTYAHRPGH